ncbi:N-acetyltransferase [Paroceanicella profunda]|uniref:N-acetyltransferase n=1 Tax=Paroceanicella profunda TaxID=2579971 RepID=A0A5B8G3V1_9RHOB|nr:N-acetyltransferase [Paroceanicella profunda]QDL93493.1 N-acetyltransferase [Paroceanicella profunda]
MTPRIRPEEPRDTAAVAALVAAAFGRPGEAALVAALRGSGEVSQALVAETDTGTLCGHVMFSPLRLVFAEAELAAQALAPVSVSPDHQRRGVGAALVRAGLAAAAGPVLVLGAPEWYSRFGFSWEATRPLISPFPWAGRAFMAFDPEGVLTGREHGRVHYPEAFRLVA